ncbi:hypothetical protein ACFWGM_10785 [Streptomyces roseolus]|uniref:hypothetical protein n=1 Tax=Streptomyces roseolus TaxID=67358 RepID=UPI00363BB816
METTTAVATDADAVAELHTASRRRAYATLFSAHYLDGPLLAERRQVWRRGWPIPSRRQRSRLRIAERDPAERRRR